MYYEPMTDEDRAIIEALKIKPQSGFNFSDDRVMRNATYRHYLAVPACPSCGGTDIVADGAADWDIGAQDWRLSDMYAQRAYCHDCDCETYTTDIYYQREDVDRQNSERVEVTTATLETFMEETGCEIDSAASDLLANLMHWCAANGRDFGRELDRAREHFTAEIMGHRVTRRFGDKSLREENEERAA